MGLDSAMLSTTYILVALSMEQASVRLGVQAFQHYVRATLRQQSGVTLGQLEYACETLDRLYQACYWRKTEQYLIPAIRELTERADQLLDELGKLNAAAFDIVRAMQARLAAMDAQQEQPVDHICAGIEDFCQTLLIRLEKEERELFVVARSVILGDAWFSIANQFLQHDAQMLEERGQSNVHPLPRPRRAPAPSSPLPAPIIK